MIVIALLLAFVLNIFFWAYAANLPRWVERWGFPVTILLLIGLLVFQKFWEGNALSDTSGITETPLLRKGQWETRLIAALIVLLALLGIWALRYTRFGLYRLIWTGMQNGAFEK
jgi:ABC-type uncharacterized transport system permease subunit